MKWQMPPLPVKTIFFHYSAAFKMFPINTAISDLKAGDSTPDRSPSRASTCTNEDTHGICVEMYTSESDGDSATNTDSDERAASQGKLCFHVQIDWGQNQITINLKQALRFVKTLLIELGRAASTHFFAIDRN